MKDVMALAICSSLERSDVTFFKWRSLQVTSLPWPSARHFRSDVTSQNFWNFFFRENVWNCPKCQKKVKKKFQKFLVTSLQVTSLPWPSASHFSSDRHLNAVTVTSFKWRADGQSHWVHNKSSSYLQHN